MFRVHTNSPPSYVFSHFRLSSPDELYDLHLKLILLSHYHLETMQLHYLHPAERNKLPDFIRKSASLSLCKTTSKHNCSKFITTICPRLSSVTRFCARCFLFKRTINDSLITIIIKTLKMDVINSGATTLTFKF